MAGSGVTIIDIARALGISKTAVSSALHGSGRVSDATRERVLVQAESMGYVSNRAAQRLRGGRHGALGLHIPADVRELAFYMEFAFGAAGIASETGNDLVLLADSEAAKKPRPAIDGLLAVDPTPASFPAVLAGVGDVPVVAVGEYRGPERERVSAWIAADHGRLVREVLDELQREGAEAPALVGLEEEREPLWARQVVAGHRDWCRERGIVPVLLRLPVTPGDDEVLSALDATADAGADAVVWVSQGIALRALALQAARPGGDRVMATMAAEPGLTSIPGVDLRAREYGRAAAALLLRVVAGESEPGERVVHEARIVGRSHGG